jgi:Tfp pilus assembly protein PilF
MAETGISMTGLKVVGLTMGLMLAGCATAPMPSPVEGGSVEQGVETSRPRAVERAAPANQSRQDLNSRHRVVDAMLADANRAIKQQDWSQAAVSLEQAVRIQPKRGDLYLKLATVRHKQQRCREARQLAKKALNLGLATGRQQRSAESLIKQCSNAKGA